MASSDSGFFAIFLPRLLAAGALVFGTYNPTGHSFVHWATSATQVPLSVKALTGLVLLIGYVIYLRATFRAIGLFGMLLAGAFLGAIIWVMVDFGLVSIDNPGAVTWVGLGVLAFVMAIGLSWSHVRRRLSGQVDVDDVDE